MDDGQIIALYNQRNEKAIDETAAKYGHYCFSIAYNILASQEDSEECVNDTWLRTWHSIPPQCPNCLKTFLAKITRNLSFDRYKAQNRAKRGSGELALALDEIDEFIAGSSDVASELERAELMKAMNHFLRTLPVRECDIFIRRYFYVDSIAAIAQKYRLKESNVLMILSRTRKKLRKYLESEGYII